MRFVVADAHSTCAVCGAQFPARGAKKYCSRACKDRRKRHRPNRPPVIYPARQCVVCGCEYRPKRSNYTTACSRDCGYVWLAFRQKAVADGHRVSVAVLRNKCCSCGKRFGQRGLYCTPECRPTTYRPVEQGCCRRCGETFNRSQEGASRYLCSIKCADEAKRESRRKSRKTPAVAAARKADKKRRKALARGAQGGELVDVARVFERDGYRCGICGNKTLKSKRGTCHPRAPELDHIVAIALGGSHTYANVQTACRSCNGRKGAAALGQLHLFPAE